MNKLMIGVSGLGVLHTDASVPDTDTKFRMVKESGAFDYMDRTPPRADLDNHLKASAKYGVPTVAGGFFCMVGSDEALLEDNLRIGKECGSDVHNVQIVTHDCSGKVLSDDEIVDVCMRTYELSDKMRSSVLRKSHQYVVRASREG